MKLNYNKYKIFQFTGIFILFISFEIILNSCEKDEIAWLKPVEVDNSCDTKNVSFQDFIQPTIDKNCKGCHNNSNSYGGVSLEGYDNIKKVADSGRLVSSIYSNMGNYMNDNCNKAKIQAWIKQGSKNN